MIEYIRQKLFEMQDLKYKDFQCKLMPTVNMQTVIGVRTPQLRKLAVSLKKDENIGIFLEALPHKYYEENNVHAFLIEQIKDYGECIAALNRFLPYVDNWATCDMMCPKCFKKHLSELICQIEIWLASPDAYTVRFGIKMLMTYYLDEEFDTKYLEAVSTLRRKEYYINMMIAWYFATALAKQYESAVLYLEKNRLPLWVHNKTIQKAVESYRITDEKKAYLKSLKRKEYRTVKLSEKQIPTALSLIKDVFSRFVAPEYSENGVAEFIKYLNNTEEICKLDFYGAYDSTALAGVLAMRGNHITLFFVDAENHRKGIGRQLFESMQNEYADSEFTVNSSPYAVEFYKHIGFVPTDSEQTTNGIRYTPMLYKEKEKA